MGQTDLAKSKTGEKKESFACSTNTYYARQEARYKRHRAPGAHSLLSGCSQSNVGDEYRFVLALSPRPFRNSLKSKERCWPLWLFFFPFFSFWLCLHFLSLSPHFWYHPWKGTNRKSGGRRLPVLVQGSHYQSRSGFSEVLLLFFLMLIASSCCKMAEGPPGIISTGHRKKRETQRLMVLSNLFQ